MRPKLSLKLQATGAAELQGITSSWMLRLATWRTTRRQRGERGALLSGLPPTRCYMQSSRYLSPRGIQGGLRKVYPGRESSNTALSTHLLTVNELQPGGRHIISPSQRLIPKNPGCQSSELDWLPAFESRARKNALRRPLGTQ